MNARIVDAVVVIAIDLRDLGSASRVAAREMQHLIVEPVSYTHLDVYKRQVHSPGSLVP